MLCLISSLLYMANNRYETFAARLDNYRRESRLRTIPGNIREGMIDLTSNDYLGLAAENSEYTFTASEMSSSASRLLCSRQSAYQSLETLLSELYGRPALLFNSGYHANTGAISALAHEGVTIICDKLIHASMIDGIRLSKADFKRFRHNDVEQCEKIVSATENNGKIPLVITESIFSMDGDTAPLKDFVAMRRRHPSMLLYVDEAHAFGVRGQRGLGLCEESGLLDEVDILVGTFGKAAASMGAFVISSPEVHDYLLNSARSFIFSTALPPACIAHSERMVRCIIEASDRREKIKRLSERFRKGIEEITGQSNPSASQIVPLLVGDAAKAVNIASRLRERGVEALPIRRPTVPPGTERIRFAVSSRLLDEDIDKILNLIRETL